MAEHMWCDGLLYASSLRAGKDNIAQRIIGNMATPLTQKQPG
jgi:hypothetical protein